jgi:hypothetical protein
LLRGPKNAFVSQDKVRRFPPPLTVEDTGACFVVKDSGGQKLGYFYYDKLLTKDQARRVAANVAKLLNH